MPDTGNATPHRTLVSMDPDRYRIDGDDLTLFGSMSDVTGDTFWPRRLGCPASGGTVTDVELARTGTVWTWSYVHMPWHGMQAPTTEVGYAAGLVDLDDDGPRVAAVFLGDRDTWAIGDRARATVLPMSEGPDGDVVGLLVFEKVE